MDDPIFNSKATARYLCCSESFLAKLRCTGGGPAFIKVGVSIAYRRSALDDWTRERSFKSTTEADARLGIGKRRATVATGCSASEAEIATDANAITDKPIEVTPP